MFEINYSQLIQYEILEKLVTFILQHLYYGSRSINTPDAEVAVVGKIEVAEPPENRYN